MTIPIVNEDDKEVGRALPVIGASDVSISITFLGAPVTSSPDLPDDVETSINTRAEPRSLRSNRRFAAERSLAPTRLDVTASSRTDQIG